MPKELMRHVDSIKNETSELSRYQWILDNVALLKFLEEELTTARSIKNQRHIEKLKTPQIAILLKSRLFPIPQSDIDENDRIGLIGEIISEYFHLNFKNTPIHIKWRETGTSKSSGIDLIFSMGNNLLIIECKHPHKSSGKTITNVENMVVKTLDSGLMENSDAHTVDNLARIYRRYMANRRKLEALKEDTTEINEKMALIEECVSKKMYQTVIIQTIDKKLSDKLNLKSIFSKIQLDKYSLITSTILALVVGVNNLIINTNTILKK